MASVGCLAIHKARVIGKGYIGQRGTTTYRLPLHEKPLVGGGHIKLKHQGKGTILRLVEVICTPLIILKRFFGRFSGLFCVPLQTQDKIDNNFLSVPVMSMH